MEKKKIVSLMLSALLAAQALTLPVYADPAVESPSEPASTLASEPLQTQPSTPVETAPVETTPARPITGDASVDFGSHSLEAAVALTSSESYTPDAKAAVLYELGSDTLLYGYHTDDRMYPASMTKVMTCLLVLELGTLTDVVAIEYPVLEDFDLSSSSVGLIYGEEMTVEQLLYCLMVASGNDAAIVLADHIAGSEAQFVELMNQKAQELGCTGTHFMNVHGLHHEEHYTTARDMAKIMNAALAHDLFRTLYSTTEYIIPSTGLREERKLENTNALLTTAVFTDYYDSRVLGGKTGFTTPAGRCLTAVSESGGMKLISVVMGAGSTSGNVTMVSAFEETQKLIDFGFGSFHMGQILTADQYLGQFPVDGGQIDVQGMVRQAAYTVLPKAMDPTALRYAYQVEPLSAPVSQGQSLGHVQVWYGDACIAQQELFAAADVAEAETPTVTRPHTPGTEQEESIDWWPFAAVGLAAMAVGTALILLIRSVVHRAAVRRRKAQRRAREAQRRARERSLEG